MLDHHVFAKPYFDPAGFIVAYDEDGDKTTPLGFAHGAFSVNSERSDLDKSTGIVCQLKIVPGDNAQEVAAELLKRVADYLIAKGATVIHAISDFPNSPFYLGLYGGSQVPGVLANDEIAVKAFRDFGFEEQDQILIMERQMAGFKPVVDRAQRQLKRKFKIMATADPIEKDWWECCTLGLAERDQFRVFPNEGDDPCAVVSYWDMQPLASHWGVLARGLYGLSVAESHRGQGLATFLVCESLRHLMQQGIGIVQAQTRKSDPVATGVFLKLGFSEFARGILMTKSV